MAENVLYYGDNLDILRRYIKDETVDLIYLDPPFKSEQDYNVLFAEQNGSAGPPPRSRLLKIPGVGTRLPRQHTKRLWKPGRTRFAGYAGLSHIPGG